MEEELVSDFGLKKTHAAERRTPLCKLHPKKPLITYFLECRGTGADVLAPSIQLLLPNNQWSIHNLTDSQCWLDDCVIQVAWTFDDAPPPYWQTALKTITCDGATEGNWASERFLSYHLGAFRHCWLNYCQMIPYFLSMTSPWNGKICLYSNVCGLSSNCGAVTTSKRGSVSFLTDCFHLMSKFLRNPS